MSIMAENGRVRAEGQTAELVAVVEAIEFWRTGRSLEELLSRFPFLKYDRLAQAYDDGNPVEVRWNTLLNDEELARIRPLLLAAFDTPRLARLFPSLTHLTLLRLALDHTDRSAGKLLIGYQSDGRFRVESTLGGGIDVCNSLPQAIESAVARLEQFGLDG